MKYTLAIVTVACALAWGTGCAPKDQKNASVGVKLLTTPDDHSNSNADSVLYRHLSLDIAPDFAKKQINGWATWDIENPTGAAYAVMDAKDGLTIEEALVDGKPVAVAIANPGAPQWMGPGIRIPITKNARQIRLRYHTSDTATALMWLSPEQTSGKRTPFLYTQSEANNARSWVPCPDGPGIRFTYDARVTAPKNLLALMSAENPEVINDSSVYYFHMEKPIPAYLLALAVGDLRFRAISAITGVYAEPKMIDMAYDELKLVPQMVHAAEELYGPYAWGRYDVLILPPSFPIGGMENPRLTFATPTIIAGDRSLVNLIAHELAHSWSGNLVTSATWDDIWMNEGFTVYLERRIMEELSGPDYADMLWELGYQDLQAEVADMGDTSRDTWLKQDLKGRDGDESLSDIPYEKGSLFLRLIEETVGRDRFDPFLKQYFADHAFASISTEDFVKYLDDHLIKGDSALRQKLNIQSWVYGPGIPPNAPRAKGTRFSIVDSSRTRFLAGQDLDRRMTNEWSTHEWLHFLRKMPATLTTAQMSRLDSLYGYTGNRNAEIADLWYVMALKNNYAHAYPAMREFLSSVGRQKFLEPLYRTMLETVHGDMAREIFDAYRQNYHPLAQQNMRRILSGEKK